MYSSERYRELNKFYSKI